MNAAIAAWIAVVVVATLSPFNFELPPRWRAIPAWKPPEGMVFDGVGMYSYRRPNPGIADAIEAAGAFYLYLEAWPENARQGGPARIVSYSIDPYYQAILVGQQARSLVVRLAGKGRTPKAWTGQEYELADGLASREWNAILVVCTPDDLVVWRNGDALGRQTSHAFTPASWSRECRFVAGNEARGDRAGRGRMRRVELGPGPPPERILREAGLTLEQRTAIASKPTVPPTREPGRAKAPLFDLSAPDGRLPVDWEPHRSSAYGEPPPTAANLVPFSEVGSGAWWWRDGVGNIFLLAPLGALLALRGAGWRFVLVLSGVSSLLIETTQLFLPDRHTQVTDVILNAAGAALGAIAILAWRRRVERTPHDRVPTP